MIDRLIAILTATPSLRTAYSVESPKLVIRVSRRLKYYKRNRTNEFVVTIGAPNYLAVKFIKLCKKAGEPFPVKQIQYELYPKKRLVKAKK